MLIGLIDADNWKGIRNNKKVFPNLPLMKISAWHKQRGDVVEWHQGQKEYDKVYMSKVFSFTGEYPFVIKAKEILKGGTGFCISTIDGKEYFDQSKNVNLPEEIEHIFPDYGLYGIDNTAFGFMSRGCPRGCDFCHVKDKEGLCATKVADLSEFWNGQKEIKLLDPNVLACKDWRDILQQLIDSGALVDFTQGLDIRLMTSEKAAMLKQIRVKQVHFAYDRYQDKKFIEPKFIEFKNVTQWTRNRVSVYVLTNFDTTIEQDLDRIMFLRSLDFNPYVMRYDKEHIPRGSEINALARWCNTKMIFWKCPTFEQYKREVKQGLWK